MNKQEERLEYAKPLPPGIELLRTLSTDGKRSFELAWSPDGRWLAAGLEDGIVRVWDVESGDVVMSSLRHADSVYGVAWSPDGRWLASASKDGTVYRTEASTWKPTVNLSLSSKSIYGVAWTPDGRWLASASKDAQLSLWRTESAPFHSVVHQMGFEEYHRGLTKLDSTYSIAWSPNGLRLAVGLDVGKFMVFNFQAGTVLQAASHGRRHHSYEGHRGEVNSVAWLPSGSEIVSCGDDGTVRLWDVESGRPRYVFEGHSKAVVCVRPSYDGRLLASKSFDSTVRLWSVEEGRALAVLREPTTNALGGLAFHPSKLLLATRDTGTHSINNWRLDY